MLFALLGKYNPMMLKTVIAKEDEVFNNPPEGIEVVARYAIVGERGGFINIVKTTHAESLGILLSNFVGLIQFVAPWRAAFCPVMMEMRVGEQTLMA